MSTIPSDILICLKRFKKALQSQKYEISKEQYVEIKQTHLAWFEGVGYVEFNTSEELDKAIKNWNLHTVKES